MTEQAADTMIYLATSNDVSDRNGKYFVDRKKTPAAGKYHTPKREQMIFNYCGELTMK